MTTSRYAKLQTDPLRAEADGIAASIAEALKTGAHRPVVDNAAIQYRDGAGLVLDKIRRRFPWLELSRADGGYNAWQVKAAVAKVPPLRMETVKRSDDRKGFVVLPRRWVVERTFPALDETGVWPRTSRTCRNPDHLREPSPLSSLPSGGVPGQRP